jgi:hypothetical protein
VVECKGCRGEVERSFRFCPWCAAPQRLKLVEFFPATPIVPWDGGRALRVSRYLGGEEGDHVRFSVWSVEGKAEAAVSIDDVEARRLARFLALPGRARRRRRLLSHS